MGPTLVDVFEELGRYSERIPLSVLQLWLEEIDVSFELVRPYVRFEPTRYVRNLMHTGPAYQALVLCWRNGHRSPIHDHGGSSCGVKVVRGVATETLFDRAGNGMIYPVLSRQLPDGYVCASQDADIHQVSNLQADQADLITLHVYSPPLLHMNAYSLLDSSVSRFFDPINDQFTDGGGI